MPAATPPPPTATTYRYLALGDSYTIGQSVDAHERFPYLTAALLRNQNIAVSEPDYIATTGWTTRNLLAAIDAKKELGTYDFVTLLIGVNDQYQGVDTATYRLRFEQLLDKAVALAGHRSNRVFVLSIPDYSATPFVDEADKASVHTEINAFNVINKDCTLRRGIAYIDITPLTREVAADGSLLAGDHLHYSAREHQLWAALLAPVVKAAL